MSEAIPRTRRMGRVTIFFTAVLCLAAPIPAFTQHTNSATCAVTYDTLGHVAYFLWAASAILGGLCVAIDLLRRRWWSLVAIPLCGIVSVIAVVLLFAKAPACGDWIL